MTGFKPSTPQRTRNTTAEKRWKIDHFFEQPYISLEREKFYLLIHLKHDTKILLNKKDLSDRRNDRRQTFDSTMKGKNQRKKMWNID